MMAIGELVAFAAGALRGHRLRTGLSVAGVAVGIAAVIALTALGEGARKYVVQEFSALGTNLLIVLPGRVETTGMMPFGGVVNDLTIDDYKAVATRIPEVLRAAPLATGEETLRYGGRSRAVPVIGTTEELVEVRRLKVGAGQFLPPGDPEQGGAEMVLGVKVAKELFGAESPLGEVVRLGDWRFRVVGVIAPRGRSLGFDFDELVFVPARTSMRIFNRSSLFRILVELHPGEDLEVGRRAILDLLAARHRAEDVTVITQDAVVNTLESILGVLTLALVSIASVSLTVAGVGIMNVMLVAVSERRHEIGLLKALGASTAQIIAVFIAEAAVLSTLGGVAGLAVGGAAVKAFVGVYPNFPAATPIWAIIASLAMSVVVGVFFGVVPARRAARLDPVQALVGR
jgi:putative ABC transport system permease protein